MKVSFELPGLMKEMRQLKDKFGFMEHQWHFPRIVFWEIEIMPHESLVFDMLYK